MYMGHLIALLGLTLFARSRVVFAFALANAFWFNARVERDEQRLHPLFGAEYDAYCGRVPRWL
jgi:protein-S-isoprenylcysteine O-methyltransferase Ste14